MHTNCHPLAIAAGALIALFAGALIVKLIGIADAAIKFWRAPNLPKTGLR